MRCVAIIVLVCASVASGFRATIPRVAVRSINRLQMSEKTDLVPLDKTNIENAAAVSGGIVGFAIGGPVFGIILAAVSNYVSKKEDSDYGSALRGFGKTVIESYNFLTTLNNKNDITGSASSSFDKFITNAEIESEGFGKFTKASDKFVSKVKDFNTEYDLLGKGKQAIIAGSALTDAALERIEELNAKVMS
jgi:predicted transcriptional regulator